MVQQLIAQSADFEKIKEGILTELSWNTRLELNAGDVVILHPMYRKSKFASPRIGEEKVQIKVTDVEFVCTSFIKKEITKVKFKLSERKKVLRDG